MCAKSLCKHKIKQIQNIRIESKMSAIYSTTSTRIFTWTRWGDREKGGECWWTGVGNWISSYYQYQIFSTSRCWRLILLWNVPVIHLTSPHTGRIAVDIDCLCWWHISNISKIKNSISLINSNFFVSVSFKYCDKHNMIISWKFQLFGLYLHITFSV